MKEENKRLILALAKIQMQNQKLVREKEQAERAQKKAAEKRAEHLRNKEELKVYYTNETLALTETAPTVTEKERLEITTLMKLMDIVDACLPGKPQWFGRVQEEDNSVRWIPPHLEHQELKQYTLAQNVAAQCLGALRRHFGQERLPIKKLEVPNRNKIYRLRAWCSVSLI